MSKQPSKKRRITGPTFLTSWLEKSTPASNCSQTDHENHHLEQSPELEIQPSPECTESQDGQTETSLLCNLCITFNKKPMNGSLIWTSKPCITVTLESISKHAKSDAHKEAEQLEAQRILSGNGQGLVQAVAAQASMEKTALIGAFRSLYWLASEEIPHTTKYSSLLGYAKRMGCSYLNHLQKGGNANYESQRTLQEMLHIIAEQIAAPILQDICNSRYYSILIDETTDIAVIKQMTILARYITENNQVKTSFLGMVELPDGKAETIMNALDKFLNELQLPTEDLIGLGSDGASVMVGRKSGVAARLKQRNPELVNVHCIAHRLALAAAQATDNIPYLKKFKDLLQQIFKFYQNSAVRMSGLKEIETILGGPQLKMKEVLDTRWLSHDRAVTAIRECLPALIASLEREASERSDATAAGLAMFVKTTKFVASIHMMSDILPHLARLSKTFQKTDIDFTLIETLVSATQITITKLIEQPGHYMQSLPTCLDSLSEYGVRLRQSDIDNFKRDIYQPYLENVIQNLHDRFPDNPVLDALSVMDPDLLNADDPSLNEWVQHIKLKTLAKHFKSVGSEIEVLEEWETLRTLLVKECKDMTFRKTMNKVASLGTLYPCLSKYAAIGLVLPVSTADCERCFSCLNRVKTCLRNRLCQKVLNCLMHISIEGPKEEAFDFDKCVVTFGKLKQRKISTK
ncbi:zinc finger protein 862-like [Mytilus edulis]|uniref:zinc finger protein 862-like n=1 Tax=Mytilus edulis TaxID=6550 RepID=UPI0039F05CB5